MVSYDVVDKKGKPNVQVEIGGEKKTFSPEEISAMILGKMKETAGLYHLDTAVWSCLSHCTMQASAQCLYMEKHLLYSILSFMNS